MEEFKIDIKLLNRWVVWYHKQDEPSWDRSTYLKIFSFETILELEGIDRKQLENIESSFIEAVKQTGKSLNKRK